MSEKKPTVEELHAQIKEMQEKQAQAERRERLLRVNKVELGGYVKEIEPLPQSPKKDSDGNIVIGEDGQPTFDPFFKCVVAGMGVDESVYFGVEVANNVKVGAPYLFEGYIKDRKFKVKNAVEI